MLSLKSPLFCCCWDLFFNNKCVSCVGVDLSGVNTTANIMVGFPNRFQDEERTWNNVLSKLEQELLQISSLLYMPSQKVVMIRMHNKGKLCIELIIIKNPIHLVFRKYPPPPPNSAMKRFYYY